MSCKKLPTRSPHFHLLSILLVCDPVCDQRTLETLTMMNSMAVPNTFSGMIEAFLTNDNLIRKKAENLYKAMCADNSVQVLHELLQLLRMHQQQEQQQLRSLVVILIKRLFAPPAQVWKNIPQETDRQHIKQALLTAIEQESIGHIRHKLGFLIGQVTSSIGGLAQWPELLSHIMNASQRTDSTVHREMAFHLLFCLADSCSNYCSSPSELVLYLSSTFPHIKSLLQAGLQDSASIQVQVTTLKAYCSILLSLSSRPDGQESYQSQMYALLPQTLRVFERVLTQGDESRANEILESFIDLAMEHPACFEPYLSHVCQAMIFTTRSISLDVQTRELALECLLSLMENSSPQSSNQLVQTELIPLVMDCMSEVHDDDQWHVKFDDPQTFTEFGSEEDLEDNQLSETGAAALDRISSCMDGSLILPLVLPIVDDFLFQANLEHWQKRRAGLYALSILSDGCKRQMFPHLDRMVLNMVLPFGTADHHPRVRYAAMHCLGQLAEDFGRVKSGKNFQARYYAHFVPHVLSVFKNPKEVPRIHALAASALINFCTVECCKSSHVAPYQDELLRTLGQLLRQHQSYRAVQEQVITAVACLAKILGDGFLAYYSVFMPLAEQVLRTASGKENGLLRGKAVECMTLIGQGVGLEVFRADAHPLMQLLLSSLQLEKSSEHDDDVERQYMIQACCRIGSILGEEFCPYMPHVLPQLMTLAQLDPQVELVELEEQEEDTQPHMEQVTVNIEGLGKRRLKINTSTIEEKLNACNMIYQYATDLEGAFGPFVTQVAQVMIPLLEFSYSDAVRVVAIVTLPRLVYCCLCGTNSGHHEALELMNVVIVPLMSTMSSCESNSMDDLEVLSACTESLATLLQFYFEYTDEIHFADSDLMNLLEQILTLIRESTDRLVEHQGADYREDLEFEEGILTNLVESIGWIIKRQQQAFVPVFMSHIAPVVDQMLKRSMGNSALSIVTTQALCSIDDIIEHGGQHAENLVRTYRPTLLQAVSSSNSPANVRQAAAYGIKVIVEHHPPQSLDKSWPSQASEALLSAIHREDAKDSAEDEASTDNAISAFLSLCLEQHATLENQHQNPLTMILDWLPLSSDLIEAREVHDTLVRLVQENHSGIVGGPSWTHFGSLVRILADTVLLDGECEDEEDCVLDDARKTELFTILAQVQTKLPAGRWTLAWSNLSPQQQQAFESGSHQYLI